MASWFYASEGRQQGPYPEGQFRDLIAQGVVRGDTLVWSEGMAGWQKAAEIPGLIGGGGAPPMMMPVGGGPPVMASGGHGGGVLSIDFGILEFTWRTLAFLIGSIFVIPVPWLLVWYTKWIMSCVRVPGRPNISFTGNAMTIVPWYFGAIVLAIAVAMIGISWLNNLMGLVEIALYWLFIRWIVAKHRLQRTAAWPELLGYALGLSWLEHSAGAFGHHHHRLGVGLCCADPLVLPQHPGHAARDRLQWHRPAVSLARARDRDPLQLHHPHPVDVSLDDGVAGVADRTRVA